MVASTVPCVQRADRGGEREDLRGQAGGRFGCARGAGGRKRGLWNTLAREQATEIGRLAAEAARPLGGGPRGGGRPGRWSGPRRWPRATGSWGGSRPPRP